MIAALLLALQAPVAAPFDSPPVADAVLETQRGGLRLPNGIDVAMTVDSKTAVNGAIILHTVLAIDKGAPIVTIYAPKDGQSVVFAGSANRAAMQPVTVSYDMQRGLVVTAATAIPAVSTSQTGSGPIDGLQQITPGADGPIHSTQFGSSNAITYDSSDLQVFHLIGNAFGTAILNSANDRTIATETTISIDLHNAGPGLIGSSLMRVDNLATAAVSGRF